MPATYTHYAVAKAAIERLRRETVAAKQAEKYPEMYFFGAQGADFCFFYRALRPSETNFGRFLHNRGSYAFFKTLAVCAARDERLFSYALGYVTHYAADCVFHPYVYALSGKSPVLHSRAEGALDYYFFRKKRYPADYFNCAPTKEDAEALYFLYALAAARAERDPVLKPAFFKCIGRYRSYVGLSSRVFAKSNPALLNAERKEWRYPDDKTIVKTDGADELFDRAAEESAKLVAEFASCVTERRTPEKDSFGKNFLSGL